MYGEATSMNHENPILTVPEHPMSSVVKYDTIVESVIQKFKQRSDVGISKYGTTLDREDLSTIDWIIHAQEELMDGILYLEKLKKMYKKPTFYTKTLDLSTKSTSDQKNNRRFVISDPKNIRK
jgi:hypothetical protein